MRFSKFIALDVHDESTSICVRDRNGSILHETVVPTTAHALRRYFRGHRGRVAVTVEEGSHASWVYRLLHDRVTELLVCNPRHNRLLNAGSKSDRIDAQKLSELLRLGALRRVHHDPEPISIRELVAHYEALVADTVRVMLRIRSAYRSNGVLLRGTDPHAPRRRRGTLRLLKNATTARRIERLYRQLDALMVLRNEARDDLLEDAERYPAFRLLQTIPCVGHIRAAHLLAWVSLRHFPTRGHLWSYAGFAVVTRSSSDYDQSGNPAGRRRRSRGLSMNYNPG